MKKQNIFILNNKQLIFLLLISLTGATIGYYKAPLIYCIRAPCNQIYQLHYTIYGFLGAGLVTYLTELIYNKFKQ